MTLGRRHLVASLVALAAAAAYNVWVFTRPADRRATAASVESVMTSDAGVAQGRQAEALDLRRVTPLADVELDRLPQWPRDPFANLRAVEPAAVEAGPEPVPVDEPDLVVTTILYSAERRRAIVDGRIVGEGDRVGGATIVEILPDAIVVESPARGEYTVRLRPSGIVEVSR